MAKNINQTDLLEIDQMLNALGLHWSINWIVIDSNKTYSKEVLTPIHTRAPSDLVGALFTEFIILKYWHKLENVL